MADGADASFDDLAADPDFFKGLSADTPATKETVAKVEQGLEDAILRMCSGVEDHLHDAEATSDVARAIAMVFGCWRSLQVDLDTQGPSPHAPIINFSPSEALEEVMRQRIERQKADEDGDEDDSASADDGSDDG